MHKIEGGSVTLSVENKCKFCDWEQKEGQNPLFLCAKDGKVSAFCPMCRYEMNISWQEIADKKLDK